MKKVGILLIFLLFGNIVAPCNAVSVIPKPVEKWTCYDYSVNYSEQNPDWGVVTLSPNQWFRGQENVNHIVNYRFVDENIVEIHDGFWGIDYELNLTERENYYHFWTEGTPTRRWMVLQDNTERTLEEYIKNKNLLV